MNELPNYDASTKKQIKPGDHFDYHIIDEFEEFLKKLIDEDSFNHPTEEGIVKQILSNGTKGLSDKQKKVIENLIDRTSNECSNCGNEFSWLELVNMEGNYCSSCQYDWDKIASE